MKTLSFVVAVAFATATPALAQSGAHHVQPLLAVSLTPQEEKARQQAIREQQAVRQEKVLNDRASRRFRGSHAALLSQPSAITTEPVENQASRGRRSR